MIIEKYLQEIDSLSQSLARQDLIKEFKRIEAAAFEELKTQNLAPWSRGKGFGISESLTFLKDKIITKTLSFIGPIPDGLTILAVGGYGRAELSPYSDIDLLILQKKENLGVEYMNQLLYTLWDLGYKLGYSVRTIRNVIDHAHQDITFLTAVFESRLLAAAKNCTPKCEARSRKSFPPPEANTRAPRSKTFTACSNAWARPF
jgi:[protein-PII] uridylyltransferase